MAVTPDTIRAIPYFAELDAGALAELAARTRLRACARGELVLDEGESCDGLTFVVTGRVKVFKLSADGREQVVKILGPGHTFNDVPLFDGGANPASVAALDASTVGLIPATDVHAIVERDRRVTRAVIRLLAARLRALTVLVEDLAFRGVVARVARLLLDCAHGDSALLEGAETACTALTQQQIAGMTGTVREVVQRALKVLEREGAVRMERARVVVVDVDALAALAETAAPTLA